MTSSNKEIKDQVTSSCPKPASFGRNAFCWHITGRTSIGDNILTRGHPKIRLFQLLPWEKIRQNLPSTTIRDPSSIQPIASGPRFFSFRLPEVTQWLLQLEINKEALLEFREQLRVQLGGMKTRVVFGLVTVLGFEPQVLVEKKQFQQQYILYIVLF